ncbi:MAG: hypothetical protein HZC02_00375 [Candidatus Levybacteria bacterium]|nr:hypothetical protein [Candidatus Levybacteria bacterium]
MLELLLVFVGIFNAATFPIALRKCMSKNTILSKPFILCELFGSFVWADQVLFSLFWVFVSVVTLLMHDFLLFFLIFSLFWVVRSSGEVMYWFMQQFHPRPGNEPHLFWANQYIPGEAVWFVHQIFWQCVLTLTIISTLYLAYKWLPTLQ